MTPIAAKLSRTDLSTGVGRSTPVEIEMGRRADESTSMGGAPSTLPSLVIASVAIHALIALALVSLPLPTSFGPTVEMSWIEIDVAAPPAAAPEIAPVAPVAPPPPPPPEVVHRERPRPIAEPQPEVTPTPQPELAPPSVDDVFGEPPPPAEMMTGTGASTFAVAPGEAGGVPGGVVGGHGTSLVSAIRPASEPSGPSEADRRRARRAYVHSIEQLVGAHVSYPRAALRAGTQGRVELGLRIGGDGRVLAIRVATSSGSSMLDDAARDAARGIDRFPTPPALAALTPTDEVRVGVVYVVR